MAENKTSTCNKFVERLVKPGAGNKYYIRKSSGGYSDAIKGSPADPECDVLANCVGYSCGRFNEIGNWGSCKYLSPVNAENFIQYKGPLEVGQTPRLGACMVWQKGASLSGSDGAGHVAIVERVISDTEILTSESGYGASKPFWTQVRKKGNGNWGQGSGYKFLGFIYNPAPCCQSSASISSAAEISGCSNGTSTGTSTGTTHVVRQGETLFSIAAKYGTTYQQLAAYNDLNNPRLILVGQKIKIPGTIAGSTSATSGSSTGGEIVHVVKKGESLFSIATKYGTTFQQLASYNNISNPRLIMVGQKIKIPGTIAGSNVSK